MFNRSSCSSLMSQEKRLVCKTIFYLDDFFGKEACPMLITVGKWLSICDSMCAVKASANSNTVDQSIRTHYIVLIRIDVSVPSGAFLSLSLIHI